jgi:hypothetical protein
MGTMPGTLADDDQTDRITKRFERDPDLMKKLYEKIGDEIDRIMPNSPIEKWEVDDEGYPKISLKVIVPKKVELRLDASLDVVYCSGCGHLNYLSKIPRAGKGGLPIHSNCPEGDGYRYMQAPVFIKKKSDDDSVGVTGAADEFKIQSIISDQVNCKYLRLNGKCVHPNGDGTCVPNLEGRRSYLKINPRRPLSGLQIVNEHCPKGLTGIPVQPLRTPTPGKGFQYLKQFPTSDLTSPLRTSVAKEDPKETEETRKINDWIREIKKLWFNSKYVDYDSTRFSKIDVLDVVFGIRIGGFYDHWIRSGGSRILGRYMRTQGFVVTIKPNIYDKIRELMPQYARSLTTQPDPEKYLLDVMVHTMKHALLVLVPSFTGFEDQRFMGSYEILDEHNGAKIYLFDNEDGGNGGFATLMRQGEQFTKMIRKVSTLIKCPVRRCEYGCGNCIYLRRCGKGNREINRQLLEESEILLSSTTQTK